MLLAVPSRHINLIQRGSWPKCLGQKCRYLVLVNLHFLDGPWIYERMSLISAPNIKDFNLEFVVRLGSDCSTPSITQPLSGCSSSIESTSILGLHSTNTPSIYIIIVLSNITNIKIRNTFSMMYNLPVTRIWFPRSSSVSERTSSSAITVAYKNILS
jgi:hypothetical protein